MGEIYSFLAVFALIGNYDDASQQSFIEGGWCISETIAKLSALTVGVIYFLQIRLWCLVESIAHFDAQRCIRHSLYVNQD